MTPMLGTLLAQLLVPVNAILKSTGADEDIVRRALAE